MFRYFILFFVLNSPVLGEFSLNKGDRFPSLSLPLIDGTSKHTIFSLTDKKLMLHLFASW